MHMPEVFWHMSSHIAQVAHTSDRLALAQTKKFLKKEEEEEEEEEEETRTLLLRLRCLSRPQSKKLQRSGKKGELNSLS